MIMHAIFIECCKYTINSQLVYILFKISKGLPFRYNTFYIEVNNNILKITNNKAIINYNYLEKPLQTIVSDIQSIFKISDIKYSDGSKEYIIKEYMIKDYVVNCIKNNTINKNISSNVLNYIILCQIFKIFCSKDVIIENNTIQHIENIDLNNLKIDSRLMKLETVKQVVKTDNRMDNYWYQYLSKNM